MRGLIMLVFVGLAACACSPAHTDGIVRGDWVWPTAAPLPPGAVAVPKAAMTKRRWVYLRQDYRAYRALAVRGKLGFMGWMLSLLGSCKIYPFFAWGDPRPFISLWMVRLRRRARRSAGRALNWI